MYLKIHSISLHDWPLCIYLGPIILRTALDVFLDFPVLKSIDNEYFSKYLNATLNK